MCLKRGRDSRDRAAAATNSSQLFAGITIIPVLNTDPAKLDVAVHDFGSLELANNYLTSDSKTVFIHVICRLNTTPL